MVLRRVGAKGLEEEIRRTEGECAAFEVQVDADSVPNGACLHFSWLRDDSELTLGSRSGVQQSGLTSRLHISNLSTLDCGRYSCVVHALHDAGSRKRNCSNAELRTHFRLHVAEHLSDEDGDPSHALAARIQRLHRRRDSSPATRGQDSALARGESPSRRRLDSVFDNNNEGINRASTANDAFRFWSPAFKRRRPPPPIGPKPKLHNSFSSAQSTPSPSTPYLPVKQGNTQGLEDKKSVMNGPKDSSKEDQELKRSKDDVTIADKPSQGVETESTLQAEEKHHSESLTPSSEETLEKLETPKNKQEPCETPENKQDSHETPKNTEKPRETPHNIEPPYETPQPIGTPYETPQPIEPPYETPQNTEAPHEAPQNIDVPCETPQNIDAPCETPLNTEAPCETPQNTEAHHETPQNTETPRETSQNTQAHHETSQNTETPHETPQKIEAPHETPQNIEGPHETPPNIEEPHETPQNIEEPRETPQNIEGPRETPQNIEEPHETPPNIEEPRETPQNIEGPRETPHNIKGPHETPHNIKGPHETPHNIEGPHETPQHTQEPHETPPNIEGPHETPQHTQEPHETSQNTEEPHETPQNIEAPHETPENKQEPNETPPNIEGPDQTPHNIEGPHETPQNIERPHETPENKQEPDQTPHNIKGPHETPQNTERPHETPENKQEPHETPQNTERPHETPENKQETNEFPVQRCDELQSQEKALMEANTAGDASKGPGVDNDVGIGGQSTASEVLKRPEAEVDSQAAEVTMIFECDTQLEEDMAEKVTLRWKEAKEDDIEVPFPDRDVEIQVSKDPWMNYEQLEKIGSGGFSEVFRCRELQSSLILAAKVVRYRASNKASILYEVDILRTLRHPQVMRLYDVYDHGRKMTLISEYIAGGELCERIIEDNFLSEEQASYFVAQILRGVAYLHSQSVIHLDLKPENIVCATRTSYDIKIIDFGFAQRCEAGKGKEIRFLGGTANFTAPEVINYEPLTFAADVWAIGVMTYLLISGCAPFDGDNDQEVLVNVTRGIYDYEDEAFETISNSARDFIDSILVKQPNKRPTAEQLRRHDWLRCRGHRSTLHLPSAVSHLRNYVTKTRDKWVKAANAIIAVQKFSRAPV